MNRIELTEKNKKSITTRNPTVFFHCDKNLIDNMEAGKLNFINIISDLVRKNGYEVCSLPITDIIEDVARADLRHIHVVMHDRPLNGHNILFCVPSYLHGYWYFDDVGTRNNSSIRLKAFSPQGMSSKHAKTVFEKLRLKFVDANFSKFDQNIVPNFQVKKDAICIFAQDFKEPRFHKHYMSYPELIEQVIKNRDGHHIYIKPHPNQSYDESKLLLQYHDPTNAIEVTTHSIHVLLSNAALAVTLTSAVGFEANLHKVPAILAGQADFHHNAITLIDPGKFPEAMSQALTQEFHYEKYLTWFLTHQLFQPRLAEKTKKRIAAMLVEKGYEIE